MTIADVTGPKPWHLFTEEERAITTSIMRLCSSENPRAGNVPPPEPWMQEINDAMLAVLDGAAPYPDEALAFEIVDFISLFNRGEHLEVVGIDDEGFAVVLWWSPEGRSYPCSIGWIKLRPLTIAAHEALEMFQ